MSPSQLPGNTFLPVPAEGGEDVLSLLRKAVENSYNWAASLGGSGQRADWQDDQFVLYSKLVRNLSLVP